MNRKRIQMKPYFLYYSEVHFSFCAFYKTMSFLNLLSRNLIRFKRKYFTKRMPSEEKKKSIISIYFSRVQLYPNISFYPFIRISFYSQMSLLDNNKQTGILRNRNPQNLTEILQFLSLRPFIN